MSKQMNYHILVGQGWVKDYKKLPRSEKYIEVTVATLLLAKSFHDYHEAKEVADFVGGKILDLNAGKVIS